MTRFDLTPTARAMHRVQDQIRGAACEVFAANRIETPIDGFTLLTKSALDDPLAGVRASVLTRNAAANEARRYAEQARSTGRTWDEIAEAFGIGAEDYDEPRDVLAFGLVAEGRPMPFRESFDQRDAWWRCGSCGERIRDRGPYDSHPADAESGHRADCRRHAAEIAEWHLRSGF
jgi:hypothetical protein